MTRTSTARTAPHSAEGPARPAAPGGIAARRCAAIDQYRILDTPAEPSFDDVAGLAAAICGTPFAAVSFVADHRQWFKAEVGLGIRETPISQSFCAHAIRQRDIFVIRDAERDARFADNPLVTADPHLRFYAGMPLFASDGTPIAALCVLDHKSRPDGISDAQAAALRVLAHQIETQLELRRAVIERDQHVAEQRSMSRELRWIADHDILTQLPNRALFHERLNAALGGDGARGARTAVMLVDVDHFKQINDTLGHDAGDALLRAFAERLRAVVRSTDTVARLGGDEFAVLLPGIAAAEEVERIVQSLTDRLREPLCHKGRMVECRASVGIALYPDHAVDGESLIKSGDLALSAAKASGRGCAVTFHPDMLVEAEQQLSMLTLARSAVDQDRIAPYYQPKADLRSGKLAGFEALLRWQRPHGRVGLPGAIAPAFADGELSAAIGERMLARVLGDMRRWVDVGVGFGTVAINSCAADFAGNDYGERLLAALAAHRLDPALIEVEVTESVFVGRGSHHVQRALTLLNGAGVRIALDDFGTGYASLTHLKQFPVGVLKIDRSFVGGLGHSVNDAAIVRAIISLGESLGIETVAEGIETVEQADYVARAGCGIGQGYLFGAARPAADIPALVGEMARQPVPCRDSEGSGSRLRAALGLV